ncbi:dihydrofolate reductase [Nonomuraea sp. MG754425]|uniref:dihydrofolate reductase family protein n=1 Tax=Nonomuraea sp. MG754425 TaxID=2570319 RepID=UPI001F16AD9F|nr:dihydrofolate reductase family protein [Nonomuraea sp. MG754425]MCF6469180.1 dihydrofolate reductase [Nonomuraea sp. MG754425]
MKITLATYLSLDGVMQAPGMPGEDLRGGFTHGGWQHPFADEELETFTTEWFAEADAFLLGRRTYEIFAAHWPTVTDPGNAVAARLNALPKYVVSTTLDAVGWHNATLIGSDVLKEVAELKAKPGRELQIHGSGALAQSLLDAGLIDELRLWNYPVVLGSGRRLFEPGRKATSLRLLESRTTGSGCVVNVYQPVGDATYGDFTR